MNRRVFNSLQPGNLTKIHDREYYVLGKRFVSYAVKNVSVTETVVAFTPHDDNFILYIGEYDTRVSHMTLIKGDSNE